MNKTNILKICDLSEEIVNRFKEIQILIPKDDFILSKNMEGLHSLLLLFLKNLSDCKG